MLIVLLIGGISDVYGQQQWPLADMTCDTLDEVSPHQKNEATLQQLDQRIERYPNDVQARFKRATVLERLGRDDEAIAVFKKLIVQYPELPEPYNNLAALHAKHGRYEVARALLETALNVNHGYGLTYQNLGTLYLRLAEAAYRRAVGINARDTHSAQRQQHIQNILALPVVPPRAHVPKALKKSIAESE